ncbi:MAG: hypothetical protein LBQ52_09760 [Helicobacteraceae bacterium]|nr:hypothetical protein [Helicobacteraceae bacterium]
MEYRALTHFQQALKMPSFPRRSDSAYPRVNRGGRRESKYGGFCVVRIKNLQTIKSDRSS